jgi:transcriptional regulator with XRE-family HTH domain
MNTSTKSICGWLANLNCSPEEIQALRKVLGWNRRELGQYLGLSVSGQNCQSVYNWENGLSRPRPHFRKKLAALALRNCGAFRRKLEHLKALQQLDEDVRNGKPARKPWRRWG